MSSLPLPRGIRLLLLWAALATALAVVLVGTVPPPAAQAARNPPVPTGLPSGIEPLSSYVPAVSCMAGARPGATKLGKLLTATYPGTSYGAARACGALPNSEHHEGRAVDWMASARNATRKDQADTMVNWLLATDSKGNKHANARRLGVMYIIWNGRIWGAYSPAWRTYNGCDKKPQRSADNACHRDHVHLSLSWAGAMGRTSYWTKKVAANDYGPCRPADLNWAYPYDGRNGTPCRSWGRVVAPSGASANLKALTNHSGKYLKSGSTGAAVTAVQTALKVSPTSGTYGPKTKAAVKAFQKSKGLKSSGNMNHSTWRALLRAKAPK